MNHKYDNVTRVPKAFVSSLKEKNLYCVELDN